MRVEFIVEIESEPLGEAIAAPCIGNLEARARAAAVLVADNAASHGDHAVVYRLQKRWQSPRWVDGRRELVYDAPAAAVPR